MRKGWLLLLMAMILPGCTWLNKNFYDRLIFVEESHIGLKTKVEIGPTPGDVDFGYRRSVLALIPKADASEEKQEVNSGLQKSLEAVVEGARIKATNEAKTASKSEEETIAHVSNAVREATKQFIADINAAMGENPDCPADLLDRKEPLSVISSFNADVRWFESTRVHTYFATGRAATRTACDARSIKALVATPSE